MLDRLPPSWRVRLTPQTQAQLLSQRRLGLPSAEALRLVRTYLREHPAAFWLPDLAAVAAFVVCMYAGIMVNAALDGYIQTASDWAGFLRFPMSLLLLAAAVALPTLVFTGLRTRLMLRPIQRCVELPACFHCDHSLQGVPTTDGRLTCPECGTLYPSPRPLPQPV